VSRTVLTSIQGLGTSVQEIGDRHEKDRQRFMADMDKLREAQAETGEKLNALIDTVDRIIRNWNRNSF
jgi:hypothetical protein